MILSFVLLVLSLVVLFYGAEFALEASERLGRAFGLSPLTIGLLLVGMGTSLPEFFVSQIAGYHGRFDLALGNIVGSNLANLLLVLGPATLLGVIPLVGRSLLKLLVLHLALAPALWWALSGSFGPLQGLVLALFSITYLTIVIRDLKREQQSTPHDDHLGELPKFRVMDVAKTVLGFSMLYGGGELLVKSGTDLCNYLGVSEFIVSAILVAFGTSFPELATTVIAVWRKKDTDIIVGNIIGSNVFNVAFVLASLGIYRFEVSRDFSVEITILSVLSVCLLVYRVLKLKLHTKEGVALVVTYLGTVFYWISGR